MRRSHSMACGILVPHISWKYQEETSKLFKEIPVMLKRAYSLTHTLTSKIKRVLSLQHELNAISILQRKRKHLFTILQYAQRRCPSAIFWS